jgi:hypothetical protein
MFIPLYGIGIAYKQITIKNIYMMLPNIKKKSALPILLTLFCLLALTIQSCKKKSRSDMGENSTRKQKQSI